MSREIIRVDPSHPRPAGPTLPSPNTVDLFQACLAGRKPTTIKAYRQDLGHFARFLGIATPAPPPSC